MSVTHHQSQILPLPVITSYKQATCPGFLLQMEGFYQHHRGVLRINYLLLGLITYCCYSAVKMQDAKHWQGLSAA